LSKLYRIILPKDLIIIATIFTIIIKTEIPKACIKAYNYKKVYMPIISSIAKVLKTFLLIIISFIINFINKDD
jgi:hypothetical protein